MAIYDYMQDFAGKTVVTWEPEQGIGDTEQTFYRLGLSYDEAEEGASWTVKLGTFLDDPAASNVEGLVVGLWFDLTDGAEPPDQVVEALVAARDRLPNLKALFIGDITMEESEISWIEQGDISPLLVAYPNLEHFGVRGGNGLSLGTLSHERLRSLIIQTGGMPVQIVREVCGAQLPALEHLELWLGSSNYGFDATLADLQPILAGALFPKLRYLGLRDSELADEIAVAVATAPVLERLAVLDLSLGTLGDRGAQALLASPGVARLRKLNLRHHYCSNDMLKQLKALGKQHGIEVDVAEQEAAADEDDRYVAVSE